MKYTSGVLGGTFDRLHLGHMDLIEKAIASADSITIGLATEIIYSKKIYAQLIEAYKVREESIRAYIRSINSNINVDIIELNDIYGTTLEDNRFDVIFVTDSTYNNAVTINEKRESMGLKKLNIVNVPLRKDENGDVISSERIRSGIINRRGRVYANIFGKKEEIILPAGLRGDLRHPIGDVMPSLMGYDEIFDKGDLVITVGDIVTKTLRDNNTPANLEIIDFKTRRNKVDTIPLSSSIKHEMINNKPGSISKAAVLAIGDKLKNCIDNKSKNQIFIKGEEDLLTLPVILLAPLNTIVLYGQFDLSAMIKVRVTEELKEKIYGLLQKFE